MHDTVGPSRITGVLVPIPERDGVAIMFEKTYNDRSGAGQTGSFDKLIYRGEKVGYEFQGNWAYVGYENNYEFSGSWNVYEAK